MGEETQKPGRFLLGLTLKLHQSPPVKSSPSIFVFTFDAPLPIRVATKIFEGFGEALFNLMSLSWVGNLYQLSTILGMEHVSIVHYTRPGSSIKQPTPN